MDLLMRRDAELSPCGAYRYSLRRTWASSAPLIFVMLNPSTADAAQDDPTIRRCIGFARRENRGGIVVVNLYAFRATDPSRLALQVDPDGPDNSAMLDHCANFSAVQSVPIVCAWGAGGGDRGKYVVDRLRAQGALLRCLGITKHGHPRHPLYVRADQPLEEFVQ